MTQPIIAAPAVGSLWTDRYEWERTTRGRIGCRLLVVLSVERHHAEVLSVRPGRNKVTYRRCWALLRRFGRGRFTYKPVRDFRRREVPGEFGGIRHAEIVDLHA